MDPITAAIIQGTLAGGQALYGLDQQRRAQQGLAMMNDPLATTPAGRLEMLNAARDQTIANQALDQINRSLGTSVNALQTGGARASGALSGVQRAADQAKTDVLFRQKEQEMNAMARANQGAERDRIMQSRQFQADRAALQEARQAGIQNVGNAAIALGSGLAQLDFGTKEERAAAKLQRQDAREQRQADRQDKRAARKEARLKKRIEKSGVPNAQARDFTLGPDQVSLSETIQEQLPVGQVAQQGSGTGIMPRGSKFGLTGAEPSLIKPGASFPLDPSDPLSGVNTAGRNVKRQPNPQDFSFEEENIFTEDLPMDDPAMRPIGAGGFPRLNVPLERETEFQETIDYLPNRGAANLSSRTPASNLIQSGRGTIRPLTRAQKQADEDARNALFEEDLRSTRTYFRNKGGKAKKTPGKFSHKTNPLHIVSDNGSKVGEMTGGEYIFNPSQAASLRKHSKSGSSPLHKFVRQMLSKSQFK